MLLELHVENLLLIERAELRLAPGLNVLTGETGAGKTVLAQALDLLMGGRPRAGIVRPGAGEAYVEGVFELTGDLRERLAERLPGDAEELVVARRVSADGRTRAYLCGRSARAGELRALADVLLAFQGQHEHRRLTLAGAQLEALDAVSGTAQTARLAACARAHARRQAAGARCDELERQAAARERERDILAFELAEIEGAAPSEEEERELQAERARLRHLEALRAAATGAAEVIAPSDGGAGAASQLAQAGGALDALEGVDGALDALAERYRAVVLEADDLAGDLRRYVERIDAPPGRLEALEERLSLLERLKRKHGGTLADVLNHAWHCRQRLEGLDGLEDALAEVRRELSDAQTDHRAACEALRGARLAAAPALGEAVRENLAQLAMPGARFDVELTPRAESGPRGGDQVEFLIAANPGVPAGPLREIASGGELSRIMLALMGVVQERAERSDGAAPTLVFDEIDAGVGGHTARAVGERLRALAHGRQLLCITHLPQVASLAERHFVIAKDSHVTPVRTTVVCLGRDQVVGELVRMLGAELDDLGARRHAQELLRAA